MTRKVSYKVILWNVHAGCGIGGYGRSKPDAYRHAVAQARSEFLHYGFNREPGECDAMWLDAFTNAASAMRPATKRSFSTRTSHRGYHGETVEVIRL